MDVQFDRSTMRSTDGRTQLSVSTWWDADREPKAIVQISHGMCDYVGRYDEMARHLAAAGYLVCGNDHLGHGGSATSADDLGYFAPADGYLVAVQDLHKLTELLRGQYPELPLYLFGHSMGSFFARVYAAHFPADGADGYIFCGTAGPNPAAKLGLLSIRLLAVIFGERHRSGAITKLMFGSYNKRIERPGTPFDWVTGDPERLAAYCADEKCSFRFTLSGYRDLLLALQEVSDRRWAGKLNPELPYLLTAGAEDPVGGYGAGVQTVLQRMQAACCGAELKLYDGVRHEPHNDLRREEFFRDVCGWLDDQLARRSKEA